MPQFVVVGAGPAGCTAALRAVRTPDVQVTVIEKRSFDSVFTARNNARSYPMVLSARALNAFEELQLDLPSTREPYYGMQFGSSNRTMSMPDPKKCCLVSRSQLALNLLYEVASHPNISLHFSSSVSRIDIPKQRLTLEQSRKKTDDSALVLQHLIGENSSPANTVSQSELYLASQPAQETLQGLSDAKSTSSTSDPSEQGTATPALSVMSRQASTSSLASQESPSAAPHSEPTGAATTPDGAAARPQMSSARMSGMQAALAVQARHQHALPETMQYDLLIGADGANSIVRGALEDQGILTVEQAFERVNFGYKTFTDVRIPAGAAASDVERFPVVNQSIGSNQKLFFITAEGSQDMKLVIWRSDSDHICGMIPGSAAALAQELTPTRLTALFGDALPPWFLQPFCAQFNAQPRSSLGTIRRCSQMHGPGIVLLGDSAHAVTSGLGQGCNLALESVRVFGRVLRETEALADVPARFTAARQGDVAAMQQLELMCMMLQPGQGEYGASVGLRMRLHASVALGAATLVGFAQWKLMPSRYRTVPLYEMLYDDSRPFSEVLGYVNGMGRGAYIVLGTAAAAIGYNFVQVIAAAVS